jgi:kinetochore protein NNF1
MTESEEHIRFEALHSALSYALQKTLSKITLKTFVSCYPQIDRLSLEYVRKQIIKLWQNRAELEFQKIFVERALKEKLNDLDIVIQKAEERKLEYNQRSIDKCPDISTLTPSELIKSHIITEKQNFLTKLENQLDLLQESNNKLSIRLNEFKKDIDDNLDDFTILIEDLKILDDLDEKLEEKEFKDVINWAVEEITRLN